MDDLEVHIIKKLFRGAYWGSRFLNFDDFVNPKIARRDLSKAIKGLVNEGYLLFKKGDRSSVFRYSLNPNRKKDVEDIIKREF